MSIDWIPSSKIDWVPARRITPKEIGNRGIIPTEKNPTGVVEYESCIERDFFLLAIHCPSIKLILHQPITIDFMDFRGNPRRYTPDVLLESENGSKLLVEIKSEDELSNQKAKYEERWTHAERQANERGIHFQVLTEKQIRTPRWFNVWFTLGSSKCRDNDERIHKLESLIPVEGIEYNALCLRIAEALTLSISKASQVICYAIYHGLVFVDTFSLKQLTRATIIQRKTAQQPPFKPFIETFNTCEKSWDLERVLPITKARPVPLNSLSSDALYIDGRNEVLNNREEMVLTWLKQPSSRRTVEWRNLFCQKWGISKSQIYRYIERYLKDGRNGLLPQNENAGRRPTPEGPMVDMMEAARRLFFKPGFTQKRAYDSLVSSCNEKHLVAPSFSKLMYYIYATSSKSDFAAKKGQKYLKTYFTPSLKSFQGAVLPLQVIQVDSTSCDVFITDEENREALTTPNITASIDCYTGMITGITVSLFPSSSRSILEVLVQTVLPKDSYTQTYETQNEWNIKGFPVVMIVDNGMDYRSEMLSDFCKKYDIIIEFVPLRTPRFKAYIEQWFNVLNNAMKREGIPGLRPTLRSRLENPDLKPEKDATLTLLQMETWIHKWIIDDFHYSNHYEDHVNAPQIKLQHALDGKTDLIVPSPRDPPENPQLRDEIILSILQPEKRRLTRNGVQLAYLRYHSKELANMYQKSGDVDVRVLRDKRDVRHVWVITPGSKKPLEVGLGSGWAVALVETFGNLPIHESLWKRSIHNVRKQTKAELTPQLYKILVSKQQRSTLIDVSKNGKKATRKEIEKSKETIRKDVLGRVVSNGKKRAATTIQSSGKVEDLAEDDIYSKYSPGISSPEINNNDGDIYKTYKPKLLSTSKYPKKKMLGE